ncbi:stage II sporulation protein R [Cohnella lubricantis]|uniref:Stage II sporulation protein R n=1 Tax=Cohnella lubricantis TaxID=2163172 RepID=A0A841T5D6_9BACL|nr:stage II sporulation protein R [Cohnella lubricantis]MBB6676743.1 stage II sporulation protein R [Cohnella lubricantis]MBP2117789.1 stage II sporulation protein R [Cohnella lubricantis]
MRGLIPAIILMTVVLIGGTAVSSHFSSAAGPASSGAGAIPDEAIRIRILANSDSDEDQAVKRAVQSRVSEEIVSWGKMPSTIDDARALIRSHLQDIQEAADSVLEAEGADYGAKVELAVVPFPDKTFEGRVYPAGEYEALRVTLGEGEGANWWCVLFPALCLAGATSDEDAQGQKGVEANGAERSDAPKPAKSTQAVNTVAQASHEDSATAAQQAAPDRDEPKTEFFLVVMLKKLFAWLASLFS